MPEQLALIPFQPQYAPEIALWVTSATEASQWANTQWPVDPAVFARWHADPEVQPYVLVDGATLVGYGELWLDATEQEVELARLLITPARRGQGIGQRLVRELLAQAALTGYPTAFIRVVPENIPAIYCYRRSGFVEVTPEEQQRFNQGQPVAYLWLCLPLSSD
jgi:ribosomal protein S18 acetylase RimI-like enzyme